MRTTPTLAAAGALTLALSGCGGADSTPDRDADAVGTAVIVEVGEDAVHVNFDPDEGYEYFDETTFILDGDVTVTGVGEAADIVAGDLLEVWTGPCAESFPVQCDVEAVSVLG